MKSITCRVVAGRGLLFMGILAASCAGLSAQSDAAPASQARPRWGGPDRQLEQLTRVLSLTPDQQTQVKALLAEQRQKMEALRKPAEGAEAASQPAPPSREQMETIHRDTDTKITALLNDDQKAKFTAWQQQRKERMEHRGGADGPPPPPPGA